MRNTEGRRHNIHLEQKSRYQCSSSVVHILDCKTAVIYHIEMECEVF
jgi:hypothetical protein